MINCKKCNKPIQFQGKNHKYCDTCRIEMKKEKTRLRVKKYRENKLTCDNCGETIEHKIKNTKYCLTCSDNLKKENSRIRRSKFYWKWREVLPKYTTGTGWLSKHPKHNFRDEYSTIKHELRRL